MSWLKDPILILCQIQLMRLRRTKPPKMLWWSRQWKSQLKAQAGLNCLGRTWTNAVNRLTSLSSGFLSWNNQRSLKCKTVRLKVVVYTCMYHWSSNGTRSNTGVVKCPIFRGIGCWWADEAEGGSASWVVPHCLRTPTLPCIGEIVWLSGFLWGCKGLLQQGGE